MMLLLWACTKSEAPDPCTTADALSTCSSPSQSEDYYIDQSLRYFSTLESNYSGAGGPVYAEGVARWEWPPWLKLTGYGREDMERLDAIVRMVETSVPERDCRFFSEQPYGRCRVSFSYAEHPDQKCPIYEEFTFNDFGETTFIEAWADQPEYLPSDASDPWAEGPDAHRLSTRIPGLGSKDGTINLESDAMSAAAASDPDVADFVTRAADFYQTWLDEYEASGADVFAKGCGWE